MSWVKAFAIELESRYTQVAAIRIRPMMSVAIAGVENRRLTLLRKAGSTRRLAIP